MNKKLRVGIIVVLVLGIIGPTIEIIFLNHSVSEYVTLFCSFVALVLLIIEARKKWDMSKDTGSKDTGDGFA